MVWIVNKVAPVLLLCFPIVAKTQTSLNVGDTFNRNMINSAVNYHKDSLNLSEFAGKKLLIDFWATWCGPCIKEFKKLDSLQAIYKDDLQIVLVTQEPIEKIKSFFKTSEIGKRIKLPSIVNDRWLNKTFKHTGIPHEVWIDANDSVIAITGYEDVTSANIAKFIRGEKFSNVTKKDVQNHSYQKPYLIDGNGGNNQKIISSSILAGYNEGLTSYVRIKKDSLGHYGISTINLDLLKMLIIAYGKFEFRTTVYNRLFINVKDSSLLARRHIQSDDAFNWMRENGFCYDLTLPYHTQSMDSVLNLMQQDLRRAFPYYGKVEKRNIECWVLTRTSSIDKIKSKGGKETISLVTAGKRRLINSSISNLVNQLNIFSPPEIPYFVDQTNYGDKVDIELGDGPLVTQTTINIEYIREHLKKYDLDLIRKKVEIDALVIYQD